MHGQLNQNFTPHLPVGPVHAVPSVVKGRYRGRLAQTEADRTAALALRGRRFRDGGEDADALDEVCRHVLVEPLEGGAPVGTFRFLHLTSGAGIGLSYSAQSYDLSRLSRYRRPILEVGRFCTAAGVNDADVLRIGWAVLTRYVDTHDIGILFGCSSFAGTEIAAYRDALALLALRHAAPAIWRPGVKAGEIVPFAERLRATRPVLREANRQMPALLRTYLLMGGWVSDHAVVDRDLNTLHVFTGVEIDLIPDMRKRLLRADAA